MYETCFNVVVLSTFFSQSTDSNYLSMSDIFWVSGSLASVPTKGNGPLGVKVM